MRPDQAVAFVARAEAEQKLTALGWTQAPCKACDGRGSHPLAQESADLFPHGFVSARACDSCGGAKWIWVEPNK